MAEQGIKITDLRPEVQTLVNSDPKKYDSNANGKIDDGVELSQLLSEYQCKAEDLTSADTKEPMWTTAELAEIRDNAEAKAKGDSDLYEFLGTALGFVGLGTGAKYIHDAKTKNAEVVNTKKMVDVFKRVADGSYTSDAKPAYDFSFGKMKNPITELDASEFDICRSKGYYQAPTAQVLHDFPICYKYARDLNGKPFTLRDWQKGDPQFVKQGTKLVDVTKNVMNKKLAIKGGLIGLGITFAGVLLGTIGSHIVQKNAEADEKLNIKAEQARIGSATMQERLKQEAEMREREAALKQDELEYRERMNDATQGVDTKLKSAEQRANNINKNLKEAESKTTAKKDSVA